MEQKTIKKIGVLTSGGDAPGMNAAIRAVVRTALYHDISVIGIRKGYNGLINGEIKEMYSKDVSNVMNLGGTILHTARCPEMMTEEGQNKAAAIYKILGLDALVVIGGGGLSPGAAGEAGGTCLPTGKGMQLSAKAMHAVTLLFFVALFYSMRQQGYGTVFLVVILAYACIFGLIFMSINILRKKQVSRNVNKGVIIALCVLLPLIFMVGSFHYIFNREEPTEGKETYTTTLSDGTTYTTVLEADPLPLTTADLTEVPADAIYSMSCEEESSFLAKRMECSQYTPGGSPEAPELSYEILEVSYDFLIEPCIRSYQKPFLPQFAHSESWEPISISGIDSAWQFHGGDGARPYYLAQKGNRLVYIHFYWQVQEDQLEKAMEILFAQTL